MTEKEKFNKARGDWLQKFETHILPFIKEGKEKEACEAWMDTFDSAWVENRFWEELMKDKETQAILAERDSGSQ